MPPPPSPASSQPPLKPFPLLALPKELRLQIYESISPTPQHWIFPHATQHPLFASPFPSANGTIILVVQQVSNAILATCQQVYDEAHVIITKRRRNEVRLDVPKVIIDLAILHVLPQKAGLFAMATMLRELRRMGCGEGNGGRMGVHHVQHGGSGLVELASKDDWSASFSDPTDRLTLFVHLCALSLQSSPAFAIDICLFGPTYTTLPAEAHLSTQLSRLCGLSGGHFQDLDIAVGIADPRFFPTLSEHRTWEDRLIAVMKEMDKYMEDVIEFLEITTVRIGRAKRLTEKDWEDRVKELEEDVGGIGVDVVKRRCGPIPSTQIIFKGSMLISISEPLKLGDSTLHQPQVHESPPRQAITGTLNGVLNILWSTGAINVEADSIVRSHLEVAAPQIQELQQEVEFGVQDIFPSDELLAQQPRRERLSCLAFACEDISPPDHQIEEAATLDERREHVRVHYDLWKLPLNLALDNTFRLIVDEPASEQNGGADAGRGRDKGDGRCAHIIIVLEDVPIVGRFQDGELLRIVDREVLRLLGEELIHHQAQLLGEVQEAEDLAHGVGLVVEVCGDEVSV
ncbi:hypothetical protein CC80DRAFT_534798 [Byssothecium circinans]|uniref:F-box domain-containing protein n=1 Tax=Byssothecium circinans TaxID=147558 RepID=A0A6A5U0V2_9PLEO|nr:hypothetical protein CC80DRAFT_534798 [Byssothecium circinans]